MPSFSAPQDCDNAPKRRMIRDLYQDIANGDIPAAMSKLGEDVKMEIPGYATANGQQAVVAQLNQDNAPINRLRLDNILSHGRLGAANGLIEFADASIIEFCTIFTFASHAKDAKISRLKTYSMITTSD